MSISPIVAITGGEGYREGSLGSLWGWIPKGSRVRGWWSTVKG
jgi:hypothetical protein